MQTQSEQRRETLRNLLFQLQFLTLERSDNFTISVPNMFRADIRYVHRLNIEERRCGRDVRTVRAIIDLRTTEHITKDVCRALRALVRLLAFAKVYICKRYQIDDFEFTLSHNGGRRAVKHVIGRDRTECDTLASVLLHETENCRQTKVRLNRLAMLQQYDFSAGEPKDLGLWFHSTMELMGIFGITVLPRVDQYSVLAKRVQPIKRLSPIPLEFLSRNEEVRQMFTSIAES